MMLDHAQIHDLTFDLLYASLVLVTFVVLERGLTYLWLGVRCRRIAQAIRTGGGDHLPAGRDPITIALGEYVAAQRERELTRAQAEDLSSALFLTLDAKVNARLWVLDTIVTAAPLLGLLGTIMGIMDTFNALSSGGISDPAAVSRGIATALMATAIGIGTALYGLVGHNVLHRCSENIVEGFKGFLLRTTL